MDRFAFSYKKITWIILNMLCFCMNQEIFEKLSYEIQEELSSRTYIGNIYEDLGLKSKYSGVQLQSIKFRFLSEPQLPLVIEEVTGILRTREVIDRELVCGSKIECIDKVDIVLLISEPSSALEIIKVDILIEDINDNIPSFSPDELIVKKISESTLVGSKFLLPSAIDQDSGIFGIQSYDLFGGNDHFAIDMKEKIDGSMEIKLILIQSLDREVEDQYSLKIIASDGGSPPKTGFVDINVSVQDANDNEPIFDIDSYEVSVVESIPIGSSVLQVHAADSDVGGYGTISYGFSGDTNSDFSINPNTGVISTKTLLDYEKTSIYQLTVTAKDQDPDSIPTDAVVIIHVKDINDNAPEITVNTIRTLGTDRAEVVENEKIGSFLAYVRVSDPDTNENGRFSCSLKDNHFYMEQKYENEFVISTTSVLDREKQKEYNLAITCQDMGEISLISIKNVKVIITDINDHAPAFPTSLYVINIFENLSPGTIILRANASDEDIGLNADLDYQILPIHISRCCLEIEPKSGLIRSKVKFDYERNRTLNFTVVVKDNGSPSFSSTASVNINIKDINDEVPIFTQDSYSFSISENNDPGSVVGSVHAIDKDSDDHNIFIYKVVPSLSSKTKFLINPHSGEITTKSSLDREEETQYELTILANDVNWSNMSSSTTVSIYVTDQNDNAPLFEYPSDYNNTLQISNALPPGYIITRMRAIDQDIGDNSYLTYHIVRGNDQGIFGMDAEKGTLFVQINLSGLTKGDNCCRVFNLVILVKDHGDQEQTATMHLNIVVNRTIAHLSSNRSPLGFNFTIVICIVGVSSFIVLALIIIIILIRKQDNKNRKHEYKEANRVVISTASPVHNGIYNNSMKIPLHECSHTSKDEINIKNHDFDLIKHHNVHEHNNMQIRNTSKISSVSENVPAKHSNQHQAGDYTPAHTCALMNKAQPSMSMNGTVYNASPWALTDTELQVHKFLNLVKADSDGNSTVSEEDSHADSGKGPSETGDAQPHSSFHLMHHSHGTKAPIRPPPRVQVPQNNVTFAQNRNIWHPNPNDFEKGGIAAAQIQPHNQSCSTSLNNNLPNKLPLPPRVPIIPYKGTLSQKNFPEKNTIRNLDSKRSECVIPDIEKMNSSFNYVNRILPGSDSPAEFVTLKKCDSIKGNDDASLQDSNQRNDIVV